MRSPARAEEEPAPLAPERGLTGEAFDVPETEEIDETASPAAAAAQAPARAKSPNRERAHGPGAAEVHERAASASEGAAPSTPMFGAVGERGVFDLVRAFLQAFPQATSGDPLWASAPLGSAGSADVRLEIDASGSLVRTDIAGSPSPALRSAIQKTIVLIRARSFVAQGAVTHLHLAATISPDTVHDGLHGDVFALGRTQDGKGAFFSLPIGRRIDLAVKQR